uniref:Ovule protein n=1 Tax=Meloidogyne incognita TaxID=6306 RepID=A0A914LGZ2_MELIC
MYHNTSPRTPILCLYKYTMIDLTSRLPTSISSEPVKLFQAFPNPSSFKAVAQNCSIPSLNNPAPPCTAIILKLFISKLKNLKRHY